MPAEEIRQALIEQVFSPVLWEDSVRWMIEAGVDTFVEIGPGQVLSSLIKKISRDVTIISVYDDQSLQQAWEGLKVSLEGKVALVTGGSRGIGRAIALELASRGANVAVNYAGNEEAAQQVVGEIEAKGRQGLAVQADVSNSAAVDEMIKKVLDAFGRIDILVNNAGIRVTTS